MILFALAAAAGALIGRVRGVRGSHSGGLDLHASALVWLALGLQIALGSRLTAGFTTGTRFAVIVASLALAGAWMGLNAVRHRGWERASFGLLATGWLMNLIVMVPNGGMPVSLAAHEAVGSPGGESVSEGNLWKHVAADDETVLPILGDVIPVKALDAVVSPGDVVMLMGVGGVAAAVVGPRSRPRRPGRRRDPEVGATGQVREPTVPASAVPA